MGSGKAFDEGLDQQGLGTKIFKVRLGRTWSMHPNWRLNRSDGVTDAIKITDTAVQMTII